MYRDGRVSSTWHQDQKAIHLRARSADLELASPSAEFSARGAAGFRGLRHVRVAENEVWFSAPKSSRQSHVKPRIGKMWEKGATVGTCFSVADHGEMMRW